MTQSAQATQKPTASMTASGFKAALKIFDKWGCGAEQAQKILGLNRATYFKYKKAPEAVNLSQDQLERLSYVINIHAALRVVFDNPENVYGFIKMPNHNPYFNGKTPLELISTGHFANLYEVYKRIDALRGAGW